MHEFSIAQNILETALAEAEKHKGKRICTLGVTLGKASHIEPDSLEFCLEAVTKGTIAEGAQIEVEPMSIATGDEPLQISLKPECKAFVKLNNYLQN